MNSQPCGSPHGVEWGARNPDITDSSSTSELSRKLTLFHTRWHLSSARLSEVGVIVPIVLTQKLRLNDSQRPVPSHTAG